MAEAFEFSYKNEGSVSYLIAAPKSPEELVRYQIKMLENNDIPNLLSMSTTEHNGKEELFYDVTSCVTLEQIISRKKLDKSEFIELVISLTSACFELPEYQLSVNCVLLDPAHIFVKPGDFTVKFVYMPVPADGNAIEHIREFLIGLVIKNKIAATSDNFVSSVLELLNKPDLNIADLRNYCLDANDIVDEVPVYDSTPVSRTVSPEPINDNLNYGYNYESEPVKEPEVSEIFVSEENEDLFSMPERPDIKSGKKKKKEKPAAQKKAKTGGSKRLIFIVLQGVFIIAAAMGIKNGIFNGESGAIDPSKLIGVVFIIACADFLISRRLFKTADTEPENKKTGKKAKPGKTPKNMAAKTPAAENMKKPAAPKKPEIMQKPKAKPVNKPAACDYDSMPPARPEKPVQRPPRQNPKPEPEFIPETVVDVENDVDTVLMGDAEVKGPSITYYVNGLPHRTLIQGDRLLVGRQKNQVDVVLPSNRVGHIHAEFKRKADGFVVIDCNSKNGTYLNGSEERINSHKEYPVKSGDTIRVADIELRFEC